MLRRPSNGRNSACLNETELQRGHSRRRQSSCGAEFSHCLIVSFILIRSGFRVDLEDGWCLKDSRLSSSPTMRASDECCRWPELQKSLLLRSTGRSCLHLRQWFVRKGTQHRSRLHSAHRALLARRSRNLRVAGRHPGVPDQKARARADRYFLMPFAARRDRWSAIPWMSRSAESTVRSCSHPTIRPAALPG